MVKEAGYWSHVSHELRACWYWSVIGVVARRAVISGASRTRVDAECDAFNAAIEACMLNPNPWQPIPARRIAAGVKPY